MAGVKIKNCHNCKHFNNGNGDINCEYCDALFEDRWEENTNEKNNNQLQRHNGERCY